MPNENDVLRGKRYWQALETPGIHDWMVAIDEGTSIADVNRCITAYRNSLAQPAEAEPKDPPQDSFSLIELE